MVDEGNSLNKASTGAAAKQSIVYSPQEATLTGSANVKTCMADVATFGSTDTGGVISTHKGTAPAAGTPIPGVPTPPTSGMGGGTSISAGNFAVSSITPADRATGVSTSPTISVTFSGASGKTVQVILIPSNNPAGVVILPPPTVSGNTLTTAPATPLAANTGNKLTVVAQGAAGGFVASSRTFTTRS